MKKIIIVFASLGVLACGTPKLVVANPDNSNNNSSDAVVKDGPEGLKANPESMASGPLKTYAVTSEAEVSKIIGFLASDELGGRDTGSEGIEKAALYIENHFKVNGVAPYYQSYRDTLSNYKDPAFNVVGVVPGNDAGLKDEVVIIGAHYDHIGRANAVKGDAIANGANDNASGTTAVLEMAKYFGKNKTNKRTLVFALFSAEEKGLLGSEHLAKRMKGENVNLYAMLNFEMIGVALQDKPYDLYITGFEKSNLAEVSNAYAGGDLIGYLPTAKKYGLFGRSDNYPFYTEFKVPSHTYCTFDFTNFDFYHKPGDEVALMDMSHMSKMINRLTPVVEGIANGAKEELKMTKD